MYVYVWKDAQSIPFYVGMGKTMRRTNPKNKGHRNKACLQKMSEVGVDAIIIEIHQTANPEMAKELERQLIEKYGRIKNGTGTLTNISRGGEYCEASPKTVEKIKFLWTSPEHRLKVMTSRSEVPRVLAESTKQHLRNLITKNPAMKSWSERNGKDAEFDAKRVAGIKAAQPKRLAKMADPEALAQRKARLKETMNSPEFKAKRAQWDTPEYREKLAAAKKEYWAKRKVSS